MKTIQVTLEVMLLTTVEVTVEVPEQPEDRVELDMCTVTQVTRAPIQHSISPRDFFEQMTDDGDALEQAVNDALAPAKKKRCLACNGSGHYDNAGAPPCGACEGLGYVLVRTWK